MGYFRDLLGPDKSKEYIEGVIAGIWIYATWKDGRQVVGALQQDIDKVIKEVKRDLGYKEEGENE